MPPHHFNEARSFIAQGLQDVSLSRGRLKWGVTVPWDPSHVFYVWFDALLNYYTALGYARPGEDLTSRYWPATYHVIGKDILKFHTVFWPAILMAADIAVPRHVFVHGFLLGGDGRKMSKSLGNVLDPFDVMEQYGTDALRFYLMRDVAFGSDGAVAMDSVKTRYETELANEFGNLASRTIAMVERYCGGIVPAGPPNAIDAADAADYARYHESLDGSRGYLLHEALRHVWLTVARGNEYVDRQAPWKLAKDPDARTQLEHTLATLVRQLVRQAVHIAPFMPERAQALWTQLGGPGTVHTQRFATLEAVDPTGWRVAKGASLFPRDEHLVR
jgi:methionyl-tRNA synthetase